MRIPPVLLVLAAAAAATPVEIPAQTEKQPPWQALFDGKTLDGWVQRGGKARYTVEGGAIVGTTVPRTPNSFLCTEKLYGDFELELEFWPSMDANSGVYIRNSSSEKISADAGYEINIYDTNENPDNRTGAIIFFSAPLAEVVAGGKWNKYEIRAEGSRITVHLNGVLVADLDDETYASGPIAFQNNGGLIRFRNIRVRPF